MGSNSLHGVGIPERINQRDNIWNSENGILETEPMEAMVICNDLCIEKKEAEGG